MKAAIFDYICRKAEEARCGEPPCDLSCTEENTEEITDCDLRCTKKKKKQTDPEFVGPTHYALYNPLNSLYTVTLIESALINLAYFFMGATVMIILFHTLAFQHFWSINVHILLITMGSQLLLPVSFLMQHPLDGAAIWMKCLDRLQEAFLVKMAGVACILSGTLCLLFYTEYRVLTLHSCFGFVSAFLYIVDILVFLVSYFVGQNIITKYASFVLLPAFLFGTLAFISGIFQRSIMLWYPAPYKQVPTFLMIFCLIYTTVVMYRPFKSFVELFISN